ncbi:Zinc finger protein [Plakobranchus ocellatus]|uniref:Zinc finger protein n=1 Tax=Plakobranchus ocellatus TaxID=259542 RepID=A0AAV4DU02_9GAST|nr:Zinc finger protein [Plakobranchus ocellatus]
MNLHPVQCPPAQFSEWILAPVYRQDPIRSLPSWPTHSNTAISVPFPSESSTHPHFTTVPTLVDLNVAAKSHQCNARSELPYAVVKPKAIRLYDIQIGVDSRLPGPESATSFSSLTTTGGTYSPLTVATNAYGATHSKTGYRRESGIPAGAGISSDVSLIPHGIADINASRTSTDKYSLTCSCCHRYSSDFISGHLHSSKQDLCPACLKLSEARPSQASFVSQITSSLGHPLLPFQPAGLHQLDMERLPQLHRFKWPEYNPSAKESLNTFWMSSGKETNVHNSPSVPEMPANICKKAPDFKTFSVAKGIPPLGCYTVWPNANTFTFKEERLDYAQRCKTNDYDIHDSPSRRNVNNMRHKSPGCASQKLFLHPWDSSAKNKNRANNLLDRVYNGYEFPNDKLLQRKEHVLIRPRPGVNVDSDSSSYGARKTSTFLKATKSKFLQTSRKMREEINFQKDFDRVTYKSNEHESSGLKESIVEGPFLTGRKKLSSKLASEADIKLFKRSSERSRFRGKKSTSMTQSSGQIQASSLSCDRKIFKCPQCRYISDRKNNLKRHIVTMHHESSKTLECCGLCFQSKAALRDHNSVFHKGGYRCSFCARNFCRKALLRRHLTVHSGQKDFFCELCGYATSHKSNLERHQKIHSRKEEGRRELRQQAFHEMNDNSVSELQNAVVDFADGFKRSHMCDRNGISNIFFPCSSQKQLEVKDNIIPFSSPFSCSNQNKKTGLNSIGSRQSTSPSLSKLRRSINESKFASLRIHAGEKRMMPHRSALRRNYSLFKARRTRGLLHRRIRDTYSQGDRSSSSVPVIGSPSIRCSATVEHVHTKPLNEKSAIPSDQIQDNDASFEQDGNVSKLVSVNIHFTNVNNTSGNSEEKNSCEKTEITPQESEIDFGNKRRNEKLSQEFEHYVTGKLQNESVSESDKTAQLSPVPTPSLFYHRRNQDGLGPSSKNNLKHAIRRRLCNLPYSCPVCGEKFPTQTEYSHHTCSPKLNTASFRLPLVTAFRKKCIDKK